MAWCHLTSDTDNYPYFHSPSSFLQQTNDSNRNLKHCSSFLFCFLLRNNQFSIFILFLEYLVIRMESSKLVGIVGDLVYFVFKFTWIFQNNKYQYKKPLQRNLLLFANVKVFLIVSKTLWFVCRVAPTQTKVKITFTHISEITQRPVRLA